MKYKTLINELQHKERSVGDLISFLKTRASEQSPNYSLLLGSGASRSSGISTGRELVSKWREEIYKRLSGSDEYTPEVAKKYFIENGGAWYSPLNEYSSLFEKKYDLPTQRRRFVEEQVDKTLPSIGYSYLVSLTNPFNQFINTIFTTNFDDLINESFYQFSQVRPLVCAHDSSVNSVSINSSRPKIIKLHGDYLFDDIKSTLRETESLEINIKNKLIEFSKEYGLIVVGYAGNDRSIMDTINNLLKTEEYLKNGIYWCVREDDDISQDLRKLLWKDRVYFVKIDGFDELMSEIHHGLKGELSLKDNFTDAKKDLIIESFTKDKYSLCSKSSLIRKDIESLKKHKNDQDISNLIRELSGAGKSEEGDSFSESDFKNLLNIDHLIKCRKYLSAKEQAEIHISDCKDDSVRSKYIKRLIEINKELGNFEDALILCDDLIGIDEYDIGYFLTKSGMYKDISKRCEFIKSKKEDFDSDYSFHNFLVIEGLSEIKNKIDNPVFSVDALFKSVERSIKLNPNPANPGWNLKVDLINYKYRNSNDKISAKEKDEMISSVTNSMKEMNPNSIGIYEIEINAVDNNKYQNLIEKIEELKVLYGKSRINRRKRIFNLICDACLLMFSLDENDGYKKYISDFIESDLVKSFPSLEGFTPINILKAQYYISIEKDLASFNEYLMLAIKGEDLKDYASFIVDSLCEVFKKYDKAQEYVERIKDNVSESTYYYYVSVVFLHKGEFESSLESLNKSLELGFSKEEYINKKVFILLKMNKYEQLISFADLNESVVVSNVIKDILVINKELAKKNLGRKVNDISLRNVVARSLSKDLVFSANCLLGHDVKAKRMLKEFINKDYYKFFTYKTWPLIPHDYLEEFYVDAVVQNEVELIGVN